MTLAATLWLNLDERRKAKRIRKTGGASERHNKMVGQGIGEDTGSSRNSWNGQGRGSQQKHMAGTIRAMFGFRPRKKARSERSNTTTEGSLGAPKTKEGHPKRFNEPRMKYRNKRETRRLNMAEVMENGKPQDVGNTTEN